MRDEKAQFLVGLDEEFLLIGLLFDSDSERSDNHAVSKSPKMLVVNADNSIDGLDLRDAAIDGTSNWRGSGLKEGMRTEREIGQSGEESDQEGADQSEKWLNDLITGETDESLGNEDGNKTEHIGEHGNEQLLSLLILMILNEISRLGSGSRWH